MSAGQFAAIAPQGRFDQQSLELTTTPEGMALVRIIDYQRTLAIHIPLAALQQSIAQLQPTGPVTDSKARILFSPTPEQMPGHTDRPLPAPDRSSDEVTKPAAPAAASRPTLSATSSDDHHFRTADEPRSPKPGPGPRR